MQRMKADFGGKGLRRNIKARVVRGHVERIDQILDSEHNKIPVMGGKKYVSRSHFIRCAIRRLIEEEENAILRNKEEGPALGE